MQAREAAKMLGGSIAIYIIMAACSAGNGQPGGPTSQDGSVSSGSGSGGASSGVSSSGSDGETSSSGADGSGSADGPSILDVLTDPVPTAAADPILSGTRLKVNYYAGADGSKQPTGTMHDSMLNLDCSFATAGDGVLRCLPSGAIGGALFVDAACTQPIAEATKTSCPPAYYVSSTTGSCAAPAQEHVWTLGPTFTGTSAYSMYGAGQPCTAYPASALSSLGATESFYTVGAEVPASSFVQATIQQD